jgi:hypothetical protein
VPGAVGVGIDSSAASVLDLDFVCEGGVLTAKLLRYRELSTKVLERLQRIMRGPSYWGFDPADIESPSVRVAVTTMEDGQPGPFCPVEHVMLIRAAGVPEGITTPQAHEAGDLIDTEIVTAAQREGITKLLMVLPPGMTLPKGYKQVSCYIRPIPRTEASLFGCYEITPAATQYLN